MLKLLILAASFAVAYGGLGRTIKGAIADCPPMFITFSTKSYCGNYGANAWRTPAPRGVNPYLFGGIQAVAIAMCELEICGDGEIVSGSYCGKGPCNVIGKNCEGGCIQGTKSEAILRFISKYPTGEVFNVS